LRGARRAGRRCPGSAGPALTGWHHDLVAGPRIGGPQRPFHRRGGGLPAAGSPARCSPTLARGAGVACGGARLDQWGPVMTGDLVAQIRAEVADELAARARAAAAGGNAPLGAVDQELLGRQLVNEALERHARRCLAASQPVLDAAEEETVAQAVLDRLFALGRLQRLLEDPNLENINVNGCDVVWLEYADGTKVPGPPLADSDEELIEMIRELARREGLSERLFDPAHPILDLPLSGGSRLSATAWVCSRPCCSIRLHRYPKIDPDDLVGMGTIDRCLRDFFGAAVRGRFQMLVSGETGSGKTTMLRA